MSYNVLTAKAELEPMLHGTTLNQVGNIDGAFNRAARQLLLDIDPQETILSTQLTTPLYDGVFDYTPPSDLKGTKVVDIFPQLNRSTWQRFPQTYNQAFDLSKGLLVQDFTVLTESGDKVLRVSLVDTTKSIQLNQNNTITGNGTWAASGTASSLTVNGLQNPNTLQFNVGIGTGYLTNSTMSSVDLTAQLNQSVIFFDVYIPTATSLTSVELRFGSDSSNYYEKTGITTNYRGGAFQNGWNTIGVAWSGVTTVGTPNYAAIDYLRVGLAASVAITGANIDSIWSRLGTIYNISYYSKYLFRDNITGAWQETVTDDADIINLDTDSYNLFLYQVAYQCVQQSLGQDSMYDTNMFLGAYNQALARYKAMYKSQIQKPQQPYYTRSFNGYNRWLGTNINNQ